MEAPLPRFLTPGVHLLTSSEMSRLPKGESDLLRDAIDIMGKRSAKAQGLSKAITVFNALIGSASGNRLYLSIGAPAEKGGERTVRGLLRVGERQLFVLTNPNDVKSYKQVNPTCVLDFYVHESCQRKGDGRKLFDAMLHDENKKPEKLAYDRPSSKLLGSAPSTLGFHPSYRRTTTLCCLTSFGPSRARRRRHRRVPVGREAPRRAAARCRCFTVVVRMLRRCNVSNVPRQRRTAAFVSTCACSRMDRVVAATTTATPSRRSRHPPRLHSPHVVCATFVTV